MKAFPHQLVVTHDPSNEPISKIGFVHQDIEITDPCLSSCGRFTVEASEYGLSREHAQYLHAIGAAVDNATDIAILHGMRTLNRSLQLEEGIGKAMTFFVEPSAERQAIWNSLATYAVARINSSQSTPAHPASQEDPPHADSASPVGRIGPEGIEFVYADRDPLPGHGTWWNRSPLPMGHICVFGSKEQGLDNPIWVETAPLNIRVFDLAGKCLSTYALVGRAGINDVYEALVGYKPDEDEYEENPVKLLARLCEMAYRHATGDDA